MDIHCVLKLWAFLIPEAGEVKILLLRGRLASDGWRRHQSYRLACPLGISERYLLALYVPATTGHTLNSLLLSILVRTVAFTDLVILALSSPSLVTHTAAKIDPV